jgi:peptidoglycan/xylan/chitin deacetylase (PgdA/CDA1 family)
MLRTLVTTSWDDGHPVDLRTAERLRAHGLKGTFYVTAVSSKRTRMSLGEVRELLAMGMEIGSHTATHPLLPSLDQQAIFQELDGSKKKLEDLLGLPITSVCYPKGKFNRLVCEEAARAGYLLARTTVAFRTSLEFDTFAMPVSCQFARLPLNRVVRHALNEGNAGGALDWCRFYGMETNPLRLASRIFDRVLLRGGLLHVWGHAWEMDSQGLWDAFDELLSHIGRRPEVTYVTNGEVLDYRPGCDGASNLTKPSLCSVHSGRNNGVTSR